MYYRARYRDVGNGGWMAPDPLAGLHDGPEIVQFANGMPGENNVYLFVGGLPTAMMDPWGLFSAAIHTDITRGVLADLRWMPLFILQAVECNLFVDRTTNTFANYQHGMRDFNESAENAMRRWRGWIEFQADRASKKLCKGDKLGGACELGKALHSIQDRWRHKFISLSEHFGSRPSNIWEDYYPDAEDITMADLESWEYMQRFMTANLFESQGFVQ